MLLVALRGFGVAQSRLELIRRMTADGWLVVVFANRDAAAVQMSGMPGVEFIEAGFGRRLLAPIADVRAMRRFLRLVRSRQPSLIHFFNAKPTLLGLAALRLAGRRAAIVNTITGLGHTFTMSRAARAISGWLYRMLLRNSQLTIFQNPDHRELFLAKKYVDRGRAALIVGAGVDVQRYAPVHSSMASLPVRVLMAARLIRCKGVHEYLEAALQVRKQMPAIQFLLAGDAEPHHQDRIDATLLQRKASSAGVEILGHVVDLDRQLPSMDIVVLPTYCHEGLPRILLEAAACGVATIATDWPGCRDVVVHGTTGLLVPVRDSRAVAAAIMTLANNKAMRERMGACARERAVQLFDTRIVTEQHLTIYAGVLADGSNA